MDKFYASYFAERRLFDSSAIFGPPVLQGVGVCSNVSLSILKS